MEPRPVVAPYVPPLNLDEAALPERHRMQLEALKLLGKMRGSKPVLPEREELYAFRPEKLVLQAKAAYDRTLSACDGVLPDSDGDMINKMLPWAATFKPELALGMYVDPVRIRWLWYVRWAQCGFPRIVWDNVRFPEMLMATSAHPETIQFVQPPWGAFLVDLPSDLLFMDTTAEDSVRVTTRLINMAVQYYQTPGGPRWMFMGQSEFVEYPGRPGGELWRFGIKTEDLLEHGFADVSNLFGQTMDDADNRLHMLLGRLVVGLCLTLSDPTNLRASKQTKQKVERARRTRSGMADTTNYVVGRPVVLKVREQLQAYVEHGARKGASPNVQTLVRGHWKMQAHGPQSSQRKPIHVQPYWRGPEDGPVNIHETLISNEQETSPTAKVVAPTVQEEE